MNSVPGAVQALFELASDLQRRGQLAEAQLICRDILGRQAGHAAALHLLGIICAQQQNWREAAKMLGGAILADPGNAQIHSDRGAVLKFLDQWDAALFSYDEAVRLDPDLAEAHCGRANLLLMFRRHHDAIAAYDRAIAIKPDYAKAYYNRGVVFTDLAQWEDALASYQQATRINPDYSLAHANCGVLLEQQGQLAAALASYGHAIQAAPGDATPLSNCGNLLRKLGRRDEALASCERAIAIKPDFAEAHYNRAVVLWELGRFEEALTGCNQAIALRPQYAEAYALRGNLLREFACWDEALASFGTAVWLKPNYADAYCNRGAALSQLQRVEESLEDFAKAISLAHDHVDAHWNKAYALLLQGEFAEGWNEHEWRRRNAHSALHGIRDFGHPMWLGAEPIAGKTILLHSEQGFGDTLQFCRYATLVANRGALVVLRVQQPLKSLLSSMDGLLKVLDESDPLPVFELHCPLMSLPLAFKTTLETVPALVPYLRPNADKVSFWRHTLGERKKLRVGLVWSGGVEANQPVDRSRNRRRNIPLSMLAPLKQDNIEFYSLQKGETAVSELSMLKAQNWKGPDLIDLTDQLHDFADTAALIENLDLVISVDTATAHLAGALGKQVWLLNRADTCWRWLLHRSDSPWYPSLKIFRQQVHGDWGGVIHQVKRSLVQC